MAWPLALQGYVQAYFSLNVAPVLVLFFLAQRVFVEGITMTGVKG